jgi:hypothetical protein
MKLGWVCEDDAAQQKPSSKVYFGVHIPFLIED